MEQFRLVVALYVKLSIEDGHGVDSKDGIPASIIDLVKDVTFKTVKVAGREKK